ncbi:hypothetical protein FACS189426_13600 [Bacteroidia bacterium]|nr:hypothetical protein FACS189426_13600 [Bacteroidia bacterium]GHV70463.1 hypothetical protein FACS189420_1660 [Bacteroidia bacterium]
MKRIVKLIIILSVFASVCNAQIIETVEEYKTLYDSIVPCLKLAEKEADNCINKPFSEFLKLVDKYGAKGIEVQMIYDLQKQYPQEVFGLRVHFITMQARDFAVKHRLFIPYTVIYFEESKPFEKALGLTQKYRGHFTKEVEEFYSDATIKSIEFISLKDSAIRNTNKNE